MKSEKEIKALLKSLTASFEFKDFKMQLMPEMIGARLALNWVLKESSSNAI